MGKGHMLKALQNEHYWSPCSRPDDRYDAWTVLLPAATARLVQSNPKPWMLRPAMPVWRATSQGKAAGGRGTTSVPNLLCSIPQAAHYVSYVGPVEGWCPHLAQGCPQTQIRIEHTCSMEQAVGLVQQPSQCFLQPGISFAEVPSLLPASAFLPSPCSGACNQQTLLWACFINLLLRSFQRGRVLLLTEEELSSVLTQGTKLQDLAQHPPRAPVLLLQPGTPAAVPPLSRDPAPAEGLALSLLRPVGLLTTQLRTPQCLLPGSPGSAAPPWDPPHEVLSTLISPKCFGEGPQR